MARIYLALPTEFSREEAWLSWIRLIEAVVNCSCEVIQVGREELFEVMERNCKHKEFAFFSDSRWLSSGILNRFPDIYLVPTEAPDRISPAVYWTLRASDDKPMSGSRLSIGSQLYAPEASIVTSVYKGDEYLKGFLKNISSMQDYLQFEHFLIRVGTGNEHELLVQHVKKYSSSIYLNLGDDPGLYDVWNLGIRLSSAPYVSNANLDDRRSPDHVRRLVDFLNHYPEVDVVSTSLRVSTQRNMDWSESESCQVMFGDVTSGTYTVDALMRGVGGVIRSHNLPHCMPVWRKHLHAHFGYFREGKYGPSADWEFWLRVGSQGARFYFLNEPLGLYLKDQESYWRRNNNVLSYDQEIISQYSHVTKFHELSVPLKGCQPISLSVNSVLELLKSGNYLEGISRLFGLVEAVSAENTHDKAALRSLISKVGLSYLANQDIFTPITEGAGIENYHVKFLYQLISAVHGIGDVSLLPDERAARCCLHAVCISLGEDEELKAHLLRALLMRKFLDFNGEAHLLRHLYERFRARFWIELQSVYRFCIDLPKLVEIVSAINVPPSGSENDYNIFYFPRYVGNEYQNLVYRQMESNGALVSGVNEFSSLNALSPLPGRRNVIHIHWINTVFRHAFDKEDAALKGRYFISRLRLLKRKGFSIYWTIHNRHSHEPVDLEEEMALRKELYGISDRVYVHHPMVADLLDWLPSIDKLYLYEHGCYQSSTYPLNRIQAREKLGIDGDAFVLTYVGQVRDYKGMDVNLPLVLGALAEEKDARIYIIGKIISAKIRSLLETVQSERVNVRDEYVSNEEIDVYMRASDFGFLSYSEVLTSGSLFHWASCGIPVIAPRLGTIPAYVVPGWNGFLYSGAAELGEVLSTCLAMSSASKETLGRNMAKMAANLKWRNL